MKMSKYIAKYYGPQVPGGRYLCGYWNKTYTVISIDMIEGYSLPWITVRWEDGRIGRHCTAWEPKRDKVLSEVSQ